MEKIIFFGLVVPILGFVLYLGGNAIMNGMSAKNANKANENIEEDDIQNSLNDDNKLSDELEKLNKLFDSGVLTKDEFEKAKKKILDQ